MPPPSKAAPTRINPVVPDIPVYGSVAGGSETIVGSGTGPSGGVVGAVGVVVGEAGGSVVSVVVGVEVIVVEGEATVVVDADSSWVVVVVGAVVVVISTIVVVVASIVVVVGSAIVVVVVGSGVLLHFITHEKGAVWRRFGCWLFGFGGPIAVNEATLVKSA
jgi:hypothetical protein